MMQDACSIFFRATHQPIGSHASIFAAGVIRAPIPKAHARLTGIVVCAYAVRLNAGYTSAQHGRMPWSRTDTTSNMTRSFQHVFCRKTAATSQKIIVKGWNAATHSIKYGTATQMKAFTTYVNAASPTAAQKTAAQNAVWKVAKLAS